MSSLQKKENSQQLLKELPQFEIKNCNALQIVDQKHTSSESSGLLLILFSLLNFFSKTKIMHQISSVVLHHLGTAANFYCNLKQFEFQNGLEILFSAATIGEISPTYSFGISSTKNVISAGF